MITTDNVATSAVHHTPSLQGGLGVGPEVQGVGPLVGPYSKKPLHPSVRGAEREILLSSRLGPRMESDVNMYC